MDINCNSSNPNASCHHQTEICPPHKDRVSHCYALYRNSSVLGVRILKIGCWLQDLKACSTSRRCEGAVRMAISDRREVLYFCCCTGDNCNEKIWGGTGGDIKKNKTKQPGVIKTDKPVYGVSGKWGSKMSLFWQPFRLLIELVVAFLPRTRQFKGS